MDKKGQDAVHFGQSCLKLAIGAILQAKSWRVFAFASLFGYFSRGGWLRSIRRHQMGTVDKQGVVTMQELLVPSLATADALAKLLIAIPREGR